MSNSRQLLRKAKRSKNKSKQLSSEKKKIRRQIHSLQKLYQGVRRRYSLDNTSASVNATVVESQADTSDIDNSTNDASKMDIHNLTDGENILFVEDRTGDDTMHETVMKDVANDCESPREKCKNFKRMGKYRGQSKVDRFSRGRPNTITLSDEEERVSRVPLPLFSKLKNKTSTPSKNRIATTMHSSTPISNKTKLFNISNISAVPTSPRISSKLPKLSKINNLTREINSSSYITIDLTTATNMTVSKTVIDLTRRSRNNSVIDLERETGECSVSSVSSVSLDDSQVTVVNAAEWKKKDKVNEREIAAGIAKMNASQKGRLLEMITENIFNGCKAPKARKIATATKSPEDTYIQEMIEGNIRNSIGSNVYNPMRNPTQRAGLRMIVIDGSNVAMQHGMKQIFSVKGIKICIDYFYKRGHTVKAFVPHYRMVLNATMYCECCRTLRRCISGKSSDPELLSYLEKRGLVVYTPSRKLDDGRCISSYDDRFIIQCAAEFGGVIVSQDRYRDLAIENPGWKETIETRLLQYTWVQDMIMFPMDPLGKDGPRLDQFLRHSPLPTPKV